MAINYIPLDKEKHKNMKVAVNNTFAFAKNTHLAAASIKEFAQLASTMPIVFIQDPKSERHHVVAMLGMEQNQNLFLNGERWNGPHVPMNILRYPFDVRPDGEKLGVYIDENSDMIADEGQTLFTSEGEASDFLKNRQQFLADLANSEMITQRFVKTVIDLDLLEQIQIRLTYKNGQQRNVTGMLSINEKKMLELPDEKVLELHKSGFLGAMYAVMMSLGQLNRLVELSNNTENPISNMQLSVVKAEAQNDAVATPAQ
ncbi:SapC family protein [Alteromonas pelagimontana]|uniref:SapC family protein n=1 Tax=Alteromonas pelagimontana TaxID=1858656 RepID=A0A6M4MBX1_9ALTE|nr:SapC family protein [Alteromonas pelagimontana]QJR80035.1 SapC family protein [Alteromonas pelagimontana]